MKMYYYCSSCKSQLDDLFFCVNCNSVDMWAKQEYFNDQDKLKLSNQIVSNRPNFNDEILPIQKKEAKIISITSVKNKKLIDEFYKAVDEGTKHLED